MLCAAQEAVEGGAQPTNSSPVAPKAAWPGSSSGAPGRSRSAPAEAQHAEASARRQAPVPPALRQRALHSGDHGACRSLRRSRRYAAAALKGSIGGTQVAE